MALPVQKFREIVLQLLYSYGFATEMEETASWLMQELKIARSQMRLALERVEKIQAYLEAIDGKIQEASTDYSFERIARMEKTILRLAFYEMLYDAEVPAKVAIAEAVRLTRKFATPESARFVNAVLDAIYKKLEVPAGSLPQ